jgi:type I restriction enzyme R subunit
LFLADRNALVTQAKKSFSEHLDNLSSIDITQEKEKSDTRLVFSTYPSMMNKIDNLRDSDERFYGVGHFDLIIVDEAHRSIYNRYKAIFEYFDSTVVGLTATPKDAIDFNTFELFGCSNDDPTYFYELSEAVESKFLVPYKTISLSTNFLKSGIKYKDLSDKEKEKYEQTFEDKLTGLFPEEINKNALNKWLFNKDTVNKVLDALMQQGLKIEGGDKIGRTIIFATNQEHAKFIVDCFTERYPQYPSGFIAMIHNEVSHAQSLIDSFCDKYKENNPQIAVSVDMMDTGIDAVRVLNLVFFKSVKSYSKFWQMIGRGTRLCPDVFGVGQDKEHFLIFDTCSNFEFFDVNPNGTDTAVIKPITQQIFENRVFLSKLLIEDKSEAYNLGGDDYITKPFSVRELLARVKAILRRSQLQPVKDSARTIIGRLNIDFESFHATENQIEIKLSHKEFEILSYLHQHKNQVVSRYDLLEKVWGYDEQPTTRTVDNFVVRLRQKVELNPNQPRVILTVHGTGYKLVI